MRRKSKAKTKTVFQLFVLLILTIILSVTAYLALSVLGQKEEIIDAGKTLTNYQETKAIYVNEVKYLPDPDVYTFFIGGLDHFGTVDESDAYRNDEQIDLLALIVYHKSENTCKILMIDRNTMMDVPILGLDDQNGGSTFEQIALAHTYGSGLKDSAENTTLAVGKLLSDISVDNYAMIKMDVIPILNDMVGGVSLDIDEDLTAISENYYNSATVTLSGDLALEFISSRSDVDEASKMGRIQRQEQYVNAFYNRLRERIIEDGNFLVRAFGQLEDSITTDCDYVKLNQFQNYIKTYPEATLYSMAGESRLGPEYIEFYPDEGNLMQLTVDLFYKQVQ